MAGQKFNATQTSVHSLLSSNSVLFNIPAYQRGYSWNKEESLQLFKDILNFSKNRDVSESYYLGNVILQPNVESTSTRRNEFQVVDGQQRITTLLLILASIKNEIQYKRLESKLEDNEYREYSILLSTIEELLYFENEDDKKGELQLKIYNKDYNENMKAVIENRINDELNINNNYQDNYSKININGTRNLSLEEMKKFIKSLKDVVFVEITLSASDKPLSVFENINSKGRTLSAHDLIKNYSYILATRTVKKDEISIEERIKRLFDEKIFKSIREEKAIDEFWKVLTGIISKEKQPRNDSKVIYKKFKSSIETIFNLSDSITSPSLLADGINKFLTLVEDNFNIYTEIKTYNKPIFSYKNRWERSIASMVDKVFSSVAPMLFMVFSDRNKKLITQEEFEESVIAMNKYVIRRRMSYDGIKDVKNLSMYVVNYLQDNNAPFNKKNFIKYIEEEASESKWRKNIDNLDFKNNILSFNTYKDNVALELLIEYEWSLNKNEGFMVDSDKRSVQVEHILPQEIRDRNDRNKIKAGWEHIELDEQSLHKHRIGNLTLTFDNPELSNYSFDKKKEIYIQSKFRINDFFKEQDEWTINDILDRGKEISERIEKLWRLE